MIPGIAAAELATPRLLLRPYRDEDAPHIHAAARESMATVGRWMPWCHEGYRLEDSIAWVRATRLAWLDGGEFAFAIFVRGGGYAGGVGFNQIHPMHNFANLGYWLRETQQGHGYAAEAALAAARFGFGTLGLSRIEIVAAQGNQASRRVACRIGAREECLARNRLLIHGVLHAAAVHSLVPGDLP